MRVTVLEGQLLHPGAAGVDGTPVGGHRLAWGADQDFRSQALLVLGSHPSSAVCPQAGPFSSQPAAPMAELLSHGGSVRAPGQQPPHGR